MSYSNKITMLHYMYFSLPINVKLHYLCQCIYISLLVNLTCLNMSKYIFEKIKNNGFIPDLSPIHPNICPVIIFPTSVSIPTSKLSLSGLYRSVIPCTYKKMLSVLHISFLGSKNHLMSLGAYYKQATRKAINIESPSAWFKMLAPAQIHLMILVYNYWFRNKFVSDKISNLLINYKNIKMTNLLQEKSDKIFILVSHSMTEGCVVAIRIIHVCP